MKKILILLIVLTSCSTRKVSIQEVKKDSLSQISTKIETEEAIKIEVKNDVVIEDFIITPLDTCKDMVIDGKTYKNVVLRHKKTIDNSLLVENKTVSKKEENKKTVKTSVKEKAKSTDRKSFYWIVLVMLIIIVWQNRLTLLRWLRRI